jgi:hypothetical protein
MPAWRSGQMRRDLPRQRTTMAWISLTRTVVVEVFSKELNRVHVAPLSVEVDTTQCAVIGT